MTLLAAPPPVASRTGGWLLVLSLLAFVLVPATGVVAFSQVGIGAFADITRQQMDALGGQWAVSVLTVLLALLIGNAGVVLVALHLRRADAGSWPLLAVTIALAAILVGMVDAALRVTAGGFTGARLGENTLYRAAEILSNVAFAASALAIALLAVSLFVSGAHRTSGIVVGVLGAVLFVVSLFAYAFVPPFALALLWLPLGVVWLVGLRRTKSAEI